MSFTRNNMKWLGLALVALALTLAASCTQGGDIASAYQQTYGNVASQTATGATKDTTGVRVTVSTASGLRASITSTVGNLAGGTLLFSNGMAESSTLSGNSGVLSSGNPSELKYIAVRLGNGDYWYFDRAGNYWYFDHAKVSPAQPKGGTPLLTAGTPGSGAALGTSAPQSSGSTPATRSASKAGPIGGTSLPPVVTATTSGGKWYFDSTGTGQQLANASAYFAGGDANNQSLNNYRSTVQFSGSGAISYVAVLLKDGTKWYFDSAAIPLPGGYKPAITLNFNNNSVTAQSSDLYSKFTVFFTDGSQVSWCTSDFSGWYKPFRGDNPAQVVVQLKSDGSKWYFDSTGAPVLDSTKWYSDTDSCLAPLSL